MADVVKALVARDARDIEVDRSVEAPPVNLADAVAAIFESVKATLDRTRPDDISVEVDAHSDSGRSSARIRFRAYRHRSP